MTTSWTERGSRLRSTASVTTRRVEHDPFCYVVNRVVEAYRRSNMQMAAR